MKFSYLTYSIFLIAISIVIYLMQEETVKAIYLNKNITDCVAAIIFIYGLWFAMAHFNHDVTKKILEKMTLFQELVEMNLL